MRECRFYPNTPHCDSEEKHHLAGLTLLINVCTTFLFLICLCSNYQIHQILILCFHFHYFRWRSNSIIMFRLVDLLAKILNLIKGSKSQKYFYLLLIFFIHHFFSFLLLIIIKNKFIYIQIITYFYICIINS